MKNKKLSSPLSGLRILLFSANLNKKLYRYSSSMNSIKNLIRNNLAGSAILLYVIVFMLVQYMTPSFIYNDDGSLREFGIGYASKTVLPIWLIAIVLGILSYLFVYYVSRPAVRIML